MAKTKISEWSTTPASNTDIDGINIAEGCAPSGINDAIRDLMAQVRSWQSGASGDPFNGPMNGTIGATTAYSGAFTTVSATGVITSTLATGTAPFTIASTTKVTNLNADLLDGADWASPAALGSTTPAAVSATTLSASSTVSGTGFSNYLASPPAIGGTTAAAGSFTTLTTSSTVTLNGGTANGVTYLNGSKVLTSGSALTFDGANLLVGGSSVYGATITSYASASRSGGLGIRNSAGTAAGGIYTGAAGSGSGSTDVYVEGVGFLGFLAGGSEGMRLTSTGLGIGTSSPAYKLEVVAPAGDNIISTFRSGDATAANNAGGGFRSISSATATSRIAQMWLDADGANFSGGDYFYIQKNGNSGNVDLVQYSNAAMTFTTNATERMRLDSAGNLGIGTSSPTQKLEVKTATDKITQFMSGSGTAVQWQTINDAKTANVPLAISTLETYFLTNGTERARIDSSGNFLLGSSTLIATGVSGCAQIESSNVYQLVIRNSGASAGNWWRTCVDSVNTYYILNQNTVGVALGNGSTSWSSISDERNKTNLQPIASASTKVASLRAVTGRYKTDDEGVSRSFLIAQDVQAVLPEAVDVANDEQGTLSLRYTDTIPLLVAAIQELKAEFDAYKASHP